MGSSYRRSTQALLVLSLLLVGCGSKESPKTTTTQPTVTSRATPPLGIGGPNCEPAPGTGTMGICTPKSTSKLAAPQITGQLIPDVSEYNGCALYSPAIVRVYEAGTGREDSKAGCHMSELARKGAWAGAYTFLRSASSCTGQAERTVQIIHGLEGHTHVHVQVIVADAEVYLPPGCVSAFNNTTRRYGYRAVTYTAPGTWPGGPFNTPTWVAAYPYRPACFSNACPYVAHQFSESFNCRGVYGDCSIDEGITSITRVNKNALLHRLRVLQRRLVVYGCARRRHNHQGLGPRCKRWFSEGNRIHHELA